VSGVLDDIVVALALILSVCYAVLALGPKGLRKRWWGALAGHAEKAPAALHLGGVARRLRAAADRASAACGGCESCGPEPEASPGSAREVRVPLATIGRRGSSKRSMGSAGRS
jgi:hypothetical protein